MGVNVCLYVMAGGPQQGSLGREHPTWDWTRYSGDRHMAQWLSTRNALEQGELMRPLAPEDFAALRATIPAEHKWRWGQLLDVLEQEPEYGVYFSY